MSTDILAPDLIRDLPVSDTDRVYDLIDEYTDTLDLPSIVIETAINLFRRAYEQTSLAGRGFTIGVAATVRVACQMRGVARSLNEIAAVTDSDPTLIARESRKIKDLTDENTTPVSPELFVNHWGRKLGLDDDTQQEATELLTDISPERAPAAAAAGALWSVIAPRNSRDITQSEIGRETHTSTFTLREVQYELIGSDVEY